LFNEAREKREEIQQSEEKNSFFFVVFSLKRKDVFFALSIPKGFRHYIYFITNKTQSKEKIDR
tara:strand:+ start:239 stop:427 length:189 start_codon:yes stop_codon:yes gene_type:complete